MPITPFDPLTGKYFPLKKEEIPSDPRTYPVYNDTGEEVEAGHVLGIGGSIYDPEKDEEILAFAEEPSFIGSTLKEEDHKGRWIVAQDNIKSEEIGEGIVSGITIAWVNIKDEEHWFAEIGKEEEEDESPSTMLQSGLSGTAEILTKPDGTGEKICIIRIDRGEQDKLNVIRNDSGKVAEAFRLLAISESLYNPEDEAEYDSFIERPSFVGVTPAKEEEEEEEENVYSGPFAITQEEIESEEVGPCIAAGITIAVVDIEEKDHEYAEARYDSDVLHSAHIGPARIITKPDGTGEKLCVVRIEGEKGGVRPTWAFRDCDDVEPPVYAIAEPNKEEEEEEGDILDQYEDKVVRLLGVCREIKRLDPDVDSEEIDRAIVTRFFRKKDIDALEAEGLIFDDCEQCKPAVVLTLCHTEQKFIVTGHKSLLDLSETVLWEGSAPFLISGQCYQVSSLPEDSCGIPVVCLTENEIVGFSAVLDCDDESCPPVYDIVKIVPCHEGHGQIVIATGIDLYGFVGVGAYKIPRIGPPMDACYEVFAAGENDVPMVYLEEGDFSLVEGGCESEDCKPDDIIKITPCYAGVGRPSVASGKDLASLISGFVAYKIPPLGYGGACFTVSSAGENDIPIIHLSTTDFDSVAGGCDSDECPPVYDVIKISPCHTGYGEITIAMGEDLASFSSPSAAYHIPRIGPATACYQISAAVDTDIPVVFLESSDITVVAGGCESDDCDQPCIGDPFPLPAGDDGAAETTTWSIDAQPEGNCGVNVEAWSRIFKKEGESISFFHRDGTWDADGTLLSVSAENKTTPITETAGGTFRVITGVDLDLEAGKFKFAAWDWWFENGLLVKRTIVTPAIEFDITDCPEEGEPAI